MANALPPHPLRALYVQHVGLLGGSSRSLYELLRGFPAGSVAPHVVAPAGQFVDLLRSRGISAETCLGISQFDNCDYSYYRGVRWLILLREAALLPSTFLALFRARRRWGRFDVVHINDVTMPLAAWLARRLFPDSAVVVHARAVQRQADTRRRRWLGRLYAKCADAVIAISEHVRESLPAGLPEHLVHNGMAPPTDAAYPASGPTHPFSVAMVGMLARAKGCMEFVEAAALCRNDGYRDMRFLLVGGGLRAASGWRDRVLQWLGLKEDIGSEIRALIERHELGDIVIFRPFTADLASIYREVDVLCFPSYLDAPGRPIFEAGFFGVPSIAAISRPKPDTFADGETGLLVPPRAPRQLADAIIRLHDDPAMRKRMGEAARRLATERFDAAKNARTVLELYRSLIAARRPTERLGATV